MSRPQYYKRNRKVNVRVGASANLRKQQYKANLDIRYLKSIINSELHEFHYNTSNNINAATPVVLGINQVAQTDTTSGRTGNSIMPRYQQIHLNVNKKLSGVDHETFRVIVFRYWGETTSAAPSVTISEVLRDSDPRSFLNPDNTGAKRDRERRIEVHKSKLFTLDTVSDTSRTWKWNINVNGTNVTDKQHIKYRTNTTEDPVSGGFYIAFVSDNPNATNLSSYQFYSKLSFYDN